MSVAAMKLTVRRQELLDGAKWLAHLCCDETRIKPESCDALYLSLAVTELERVGNGMTPRDSSITDLRMKLMQLFIWADRKSRAAEFRETLDALIGLAIESAPPPEKGGAHPDGEGTDG